MDSQVGPSDGLPTTAAIQQQICASSRSEDSSNINELIVSTRSKMGSLELSLQHLSSQLQHQVSNSQQQTLEHLLLYESAVSDLQEAAQAANISYTQLLSRCRLLSSKLRGVDLLAGRVAVLKHAVEQLEAVVEVVLTDMGTNRAV